MEELSLDVDFDLPDKLEFLTQEAARYKVGYGGRGSAKSWSFARALIYLAYTAEEPERTLCARETQESISESVHKLIEDQISMMGVDDLFDVQQKRILCVNGSEFIFAGIRSDPGKVKSTERIKRVWVEEAEAVTEDSWEILIPTVRAEGSEIWVSFNPRLHSDATWKKFVVDPPRDSIVALVNWRDNPWFPEVLNQERLEMKRKNPALYEHIWEGKCGVLGNTFYPFDDLNQARTHVRPPEYRGVLEQVGETIRFKHRTDGWLEIWEKPVLKGDYVVSGDVSKGKSTGDQHSGHVYKRTLKAEQVARLAPQVNAADYARMLVLVSKWYGAQSLGIERNGLGEAAVLAAEETKYTRLWKQENGESGWWTSDTSRSMILGRLGEGMNEETIVFHCEETVNQLATFITTKTGKPEAMDGCQDDEVIAAAIGYHLVLAVPVRREPVPGSNVALHEYDPLNLGD
jgi:hypothetical protein